MSEHSFDFLINEMGPDSDFSEAQLTIALADIENVTERSEASPRSIATAPERYRAIHHGRRIPLRCPDVWNEADFKKLSLPQQHKLSSAGHIQDTDKGTQALVPCTACVEADSASTCRVWAKAAKNMYRLKADGGSCGNCKMVGKKCSFTKPQKQRAVRRRRAVAATPIGTFSETTILPRPAISVQPAIVPPPAIGSGNALFAPRAIDQQNNVFTHPVVTTQPFRLPQTAFENDDAFASLVSFSPDPEVATDDHLLAELQKIKRELLQVTEERDKYLEAARRHRTELQRTEQRHRAEMLSLRAEDERTRQALHTELESLLTEAERTRQALHAELENLRVEDERTKEAHRTELQDLRTQARGVLEAALANFST